MRKTILTGDRPTWRLHLWHYVGSLMNRVKLQHEHNQFIMIADMQALTDNSENVEKVRKHVLEVAFDYLSVWLEPENNTIFIQSQVPELSELTMYYLNLVNVSRLERNPTVKDEMKQKWFWKNVPAGFLTYPVSQAADITAFKAELIPVWEDQLPMLEQTNEIVRKFNRIYNTDVLLECKAYISEVARLPWTDWKAKMWKSLDNAIYLSDSPAEISKKVKSMYTDPDHIHVNDPGKIEWNTVFAYLDAFDPDKEGLKKLKEQYKKWGLWDWEVKKRLEWILNELLAPIRAKRTYYENNPQEVIKILKEWSIKARSVASDTLKKVKDAMGLFNFDD